MLSVTTWKWGTLFGPGYVNVLRNMVERNLHVPHKFICVTDDTSGLDRRIETVPLPEPPAHLDAHCSIRLRQFDAVWASYNLGKRFLLLDLDVVITNDITPLVERDEPLVMWWVEFCNLYAGGVMLQDSGTLNGLWHEWLSDPAGLSARAKRWQGGSHDGSDQDMINYYLEREQIVPARWTDRDGLSAAYGEARSLARLSTGPSGKRRVKVNQWACIACNANYTSRMASEDTWAAKVSNPYTPRRCECGGELRTRVRIKTTSDPAPEPYNTLTAVPTLPEGTRIVAVGHRDRAAMEQGAHPWVKENWR